ncbi:family 16 glycosylhydrolase [Saccharicrinis fermentans]|uniref:Beta-glucanase n=1 Tax=Saccharicrinis fermentans DSM 9555 = JCM 21142 TaxID=869213 RepID=W7YI97_9BACT|nr:family 16 glycosylhydrolase [Saccharicrinis fermentans]GAF04196.1 beta-glucanase precursor [Saccharicrinis fermentans DSM 9555 = JCM 21142]
MYYFLRRLGYFKKLIVCFQILLFVSCSGSDDNEKDYVADFEFEVNANIVSFTNASSGDYLYIEWDYGNGETSGAQSNRDYQGTAYYPLKGDYTVTLTVFGPSNKSSDVKTVSKTIQIMADDPDYKPVEEGLVWSDEFDQSAINTENWTFEVGHGDWGWGNNELQYYTDGDNARVENGKLIITAQKVDDNTTTGSYTSARMVTMGKQAFTYGKVEIRAKLPAGRGVWPAIWMLGTNINSVGWPACGEIDIMEYVGYTPNVVHSTVHTTDGSGSNGSGSSMDLETAEEDFHIYGINWTEDEIVFYVDSLENVVHTYAPSIKTANNWPFDKPHFIIINLAVGGTWGGAQGIDNSIFPQTLEVDYVRVYE